MITRNILPIEQRQHVLSLLWKCALVCILWFFLQWGWQTLSALLPPSASDVVYLVLTCWIGIILIVSTPGPGIFSLKPFLPVSNPPPLTFLWGLLSGGGLALLLFLLSEMGVLSGKARPLSSIEIYTALFVRPALEELVYRILFLGWLLKQKVPAAVGIALTAILFALGHSMHQIWFLFPGVVFGILYWRAGFMSPFVAHWTYNASLLLYARLHS